MRVVLIPGTPIIPNWTRGSNHGSTSKYVCSGCRRSVEGVYAAGARI